MHAKYHKKSQLDGQPAKSENTYLCHEDASNAKSSGTVKKPAGEKKFAITVEKITMEILVTEILTAPTVVNHMRPRPRTASTMNLKRKHSHFKREARSPILKLRE